MRGLASEPDASRHDRSQVVVFEGAAARTTTVWNSRSLGVPLAAPLHSRGLPARTLYVAVSHETAQVLGTVTEPLAVAPCSPRRADTQYDWFELSLPQLWRLDH